MNNKIMQQGLKHSFLSLIFLLIIRSLSAQHLMQNAYGLPYINQVPLYRESLINHPEKQMISLSLIPGVLLNLRYATTQNFMHKKLYLGKVTTTYLRKPAYMALDSIAHELALHGLMIVIWDAYRPYSVTELLWKNVHDDRYAANPAKGSGHNRGIAVDLTLEDIKTHKLVSMPTGFDNFSDSAQQGFMNLDPVQIANRELLKNIMMKYGFIPLSTEWWHFSWPHPENFEVLDLSFEKMNSLR